MSNANSTGCNGCNGCNGSTGCTDCLDCNGCTDCLDCTDCLGCVGCRDCSGLRNAVGLTGVHAVDIYTNLELHVLGSMLASDEACDAIAGGRPSPWVPLNGWTFDGCVECASVKVHTCIHKGGDTLGQCPSCGHETLIGEKP